MDISKTGGRSGRSSKEEVPQSHAGVRRRTSSDEIRIQFEDLKEKHRVLRHQFQLLQMDRDKAVEEVKLAQDQSKVLWRKGEELKRENAEQKKKLERGGYAPRGQVSRFEHESLAKRFDQVCAQVRMLQHDKEQLEQKHLQEKQDLEGRYLEEMKSLKANLEDAEQEQDNMRYKLSEYKRENDRLNEKLACMGPNYDSSKREIDRIIDQRDQLKAKVNELKQDNKTLQEKLSKPSESKTPSDQQLRSERDRLTETNTELRGKLETTEGRLRELEIECQRLRHAKSERASSPVRQFGRLGDRVALSRGGSEEMLAIKRHRSSAKTKFSQSSTDEDFSDNQHSLTDLTSLTFSDSGHLQHAGGGSSETYTRGLSGGTSKKLSSSTSNLAMASELYDRAVPSHSRLNDQNSRLRLKLTRAEKALEELKKEKQNLTGQISKLESEKKEMGTQSQSLRAELDSSRKELEEVSGQSKVAHNQIEILTQEKGVAMRDNASSYQQSIQSESKIRELQAEKEILEQQRDIANRERERVITDVVTLRRKLETIKTQRQKDAKELSGMRHLKERAVQELEKLRSLNHQQQEMRKVMEEEMASMHEAINRASLKAGRGKGAQKTLSTAEELQGILERLHALENERKLVHKKLFGPESLDQPRSLSDVLQKFEGLLQERDSLVMEIEALQESSSKVNEDRIFDLKQKIEDLLVERDALSTQTKNLKREVTSLSSKVVKTEQERDRLLIDCERLELQCEQLKGRQSRLVEEHTKTLERVNELWKQKWPPAWDEAWEEKHIQIPLSVEGFAGFSVVGGRDQPQLPNPGAFIITMVNQNGPADGIIKVGDVLESVNGISLTNADHRDAVRAVKESKGFLNIILRRRRNAYPIQMGIVSAINSVPHLDSTPSSHYEQHEYSLYITSKENLGFRHDWSTMYTVTDVASAGPAHQILEVGDRIIKVNNTPISHEKPSAVRKMMKPHKNILRLVIERSQTSDRSYMGQAIHPNNADWSTRLDRTEEPLSKRSSWAHSANSGSSTPNWSKSSTRGGGTQTSQDSRGSYPDLGPNPEQLMAENEYKKQVLDTSSHYQPRSRDSYTSRDGYYSQDTQESQDSGKPTKLAAVVTCIKRDTNEGTRPPHPRPMSDGVMYGNYNERRIEYEDVLLSERTESQYSQSESYLSESCSYVEGYGLSSQSIDLTFHSLSTMPQCRLTVDTVMSTQNEGRSQQSEDEDEFGFLARNDASRTTFRNRSASEDNSNANNSEMGHSQPQFSESQYTDSQLSVSQLSYPDNQPCHDNRKKKGVRRRLGLRSHRPKSNSIHGSRSLTRLTPSGNGYGNLASRGKSLSNLSLSHAPSMTSVREEPRRSTSTSNVSTMQQCDPLTDATYIRANFAYIPHSPKELKVKAGDVFHILDEAPSERFRASFWVSRLSADGTDEQIGAIPNSFRGQEYLEDQGDSLDIPLYEEVEAFTGTRPVLIFGALADQVTASLLEGYPNLFYPCPTDTVEGGVPRLTEVRLKRDVSEGKIVDFWRSEGGFDVIRIEAINGKEKKGKHCLLTGSVQAFQSLKGIAPPITILVKAMTEESITTFSPEQISRKQAKEIFDDIISLEEQHGHEFSGSLFLIYMDTLMGQIEDIVKKEKRKQAWVPVTKET